MTFESCPRSHLTRLARSPLKPEAHVRGICSASLGVTTNLASFPDLRENLPTQRYLVANVVEVLRSLMVQLRELQLPLSCQAASPFQPMLKEMEDFLAKSPAPRATLLTDAFAQRLIVVAKQVILAARRDLSVPILPPVDQKPG